MLRMPFFGKGKNMTNGHMWVGRKRDKRTNAQSKWGRTH